MDKNGFLMDHANIDERLSEFTSVGEGIRVIMYIYIYMLGARIQ